MSDAELSKQQNEQNVSDDLTDINIQASVSSSKDSSKKQKMEEIYSTKDKKIRYKKQTPIEAEEAQKRKDATKEKLVSGNVEISFENASVPAMEVELEAELEEGTVVSDEIIEELSDGGRIRGIYVQDIDDIDISLGPDDSLKRYEKQVNSKPKHDPRNTLIKAKSNPVHNNDTIPKTVSKVPVYQHESKVNKIRLKAGRFTDVVENEYDEYLKSNDPTISKKPVTGKIKIEPKQSLIYTLSQIAQKRKDKHDSKVKITTKNTEKIQNDLSKKTVEKEENPNALLKQKGRKKKKKLKLASLPMKSKKAKSETSKKDTAEAKANTKKKAKEKIQEIEHPVDYENRQDEKYVLNEIKGNIKKLTLKTVVLSVLFILSFVLEILALSKGVELFSSIIPLGSIVYCIINLIFLLVVGIISKDYLINGLIPLKRFKGNADTAVSIAYFAVVIETVVSFFASNDFVNGTYHLYTIIVIIAMLSNTVGRLFMAQRVKKNFKFITSKTPAYATKIYNDEELAHRMLSGTTAANAVIAYQHRTKLLSDYLKISYAPDPSEETVSKLTPITVVCSLFVTILYSIIYKTPMGIAPALSVMMCISMPVCGLISGNIPLYLFSKKMLRHNAMVAGYPSVRQFCDSSAVIVRADELYPKDSVKLEMIKPVAQFKVDETLLCAAMVLKEAQSPLRFVFDDLVKESVNTLPNVESVMYEDKSGLVGWVDGERVLIGNKSLMERYHITVEHTSLEAKCKNEKKQLTYIALSGQLMALVVTSYSADAKISAYLRRAEQSGLCLLVCSSDNNVTAQKITSDYNLFYRNVKVLSTGYANECVESISKVEQSSRAYLATRGKFTSMLRAISGCIKLKSNITMGVIIEVFGLILGVLLCATMVLYSGVSALSVVELMLYILFWGFSTIVAQLIQRP